MTIRCQLDQDGCISLLAVLRIMNQLNQEQAWALAYQVAALMQRLWPAADCSAIEGLGQIHIHRDGSVHPKSLQPAAGAHQQASSTANTSSSSSCSAHSSDDDDDDDHDDDNDHHQHQHPQNPPNHDPARPHQQPTNNLERSQSHPIDRGPQANKIPPDDRSEANQKRQVMPPTPPITPELEAAGQQVAQLGSPTSRPAPTQAELVASLGIALFWALDYGIPDDEERKLSLSMEYLIVQSQNELSLSELIEICIKRLPVATKQQADLHYREVCKSLIQDTIELSLFLDKIYTASMVLGDFTHLTDDCYSSQATKTNKNSTLTTRPTSSAKSTTTTTTTTTTATAKHITNHSAVSKVSDSTTNNNNNDKCDILNHHHFLNQNHLHHREHLDPFDQDDLGQLGLPLASLRALKINDWARLWMQVIRELRQLGKFKQ